MSKLNLKLILSGATLLALVSCVPIDPNYSGGYNSGGSYNNYSNTPSLSQIPSNYQSSYYGGQRYHHHNGTYYQQRGSSYYRVPDPRNSGRNNYRNNGNHSNNGSHSNHGNSGNRHNPTAGYDRQLVNGKTYYEKRGDWYVLNGSRLVRVAKPNRNSGNYGGVSTKGYDRHVVNGKLYYEKRGDWYIMRGNQLVRVSKPR